MPIRKISLSTLALAVMTIAASVLSSGPASAQLLFDWGGGNEKPNDSGRIVGRLEGDAKPGEIIVSFGDRRLYLVTAPGQAVSYPVAIPREQDRWQGRTTVTQKRENPSWTPTPTMIKENPKLPRWVPGGHPMNPLGVRALYLGSSFYRIHGTDAPWTIGTAVSKGCIRMYNKDAQDVYDQVKVGAKVLVTWNNYKFTPNPGQPQLPQPKEEPVTAQAPGPASTTVQASVAAAPAAIAEAVAEPPAKRAPVRFENPFVAEEPDFLPRRARAERAEPAEQPERKASPSRKGQASRETSPTRQPPVERVRPTAAKAGSESAVETGSIGDRRRQAPAKARAKAVTPPAEEAAVPSAEPATTTAEPSAPERSASLLPAPATPAADEVAVKAPPATERAAPVVTENAAPAPAPASETRAE